MSLNKVQLIGRLGRDPEMKSTKSGMSITNLSVATTRRAKSSSGSYQEETEWHRVVCFGKTAEFASQYLLKGRLVYVEGRLKTNEWQAKDGSKRKTTEVMADTVQSLDKPSDRPSGGSYGGGSGPTSFGGGSFDDKSSKPTQQSFLDTKQSGYFDDDDIPF